MKTKHILLFGTGVVLGYLAYSQYNKKKVDKSKLAACEKDLQENLKVVRLRADAIEQYKAKYLTDCMAK